MVVSKKIIFLLLSCSLHHLFAHPTPTPNQNLILSPPQKTTYSQLAVWLKKTKPAGIMLFSSHVTNRATAKKLISFLQAEAKKIGIPPLLICIDWEGGIVSRANESGNFVSVPSPHSLALADRHTCFLAGMLIGQQLADIGVDINFAPSLDLFDPNNNILATRCFSADPNETAECGIAFARGLQCFNVEPVIKHFPGLGLGAADSHFSSVLIDADESEAARHLQPFFTALSNNIDCVMCTHARYAMSDNQPATVSSRIASMLKKKNPNALLITDDFCMQALQEMGRTEDMVIQSLQAGYHLIIFSGSTSEQYDLVQKLEAKITPGDTELNSALLLSQQDIERFRHRHKAQKATTIKLDEQATARVLAKHCIQLPTPLSTTLQGGCGPSIRFAEQNTRDEREERVYPGEALAKPGPALLISADLTRIRTTETWFIKNKKTYLARALEKKGVQVQEFIFDPCDIKSIGRLKKLLEQKKIDTPLFVQTFFYGDKKWNLIQKQWLELIDRSVSAYREVQEGTACPKLDLGARLNINLGHPVACANKNICTINVGSFHQPLLDRVADIIATGSAGSGADAFIQDLDTFVSGKRIGLLCHRCSTVAHNGQYVFLPDFFREGAACPLSALLSPEHGLEGTHQAGAPVASEQQSRWGCPVYSLHSKHKKPTHDMLKNIDVLIIDLQDVGVRCFTYVSTLLYALQSAAEENIPVIVLDRPNPLSCWKSTGPTVEKKYASFLGAANIPFVYQKSIGTLAQEFNKNIGADLTVVPCQQHANDTLLTHFVPPSPNLMTLDHVFAYPLTVFLEGTNYSEGRGTNYPFLQIGAPWVNAVQLAATLNKKKLSGIYFEPIQFTPRVMPGIADDPKHKNKLCNGVFVHIYDYEKVQPLVAAKTILATLFGLYKQSRCVKNGDRYTLDLLVGNSSWRREIAHK